MGLAIRVGSNTSGSRSIPPWHIEANYRKITLHLGGIYDKQSYEDTGRIEHVSRRAMPKRSVTNRVSGSSSSFGSYNSQKERSGLVGNTPNVYYKNSIGVADNDDTVAGQTVVYDAGLFRNGSYILLSRKVDSTDGTEYWALSVIERADLSVTSKDIVIGYVKNSFVTQIWKSDIYYSKSSGGDDHPFKVKLSGFEEETAVFEIIPGTINNKVPSNIADPISCTEDKYVYLAAYTDVGESDEYLIAVQILVDVNENKEDTDDYGYLKLAKISPDGTVTQYVSGSVWSERHKYTEPDSATYYYYRV